MNTYYFIAYVNNARFVDRTKLMVTTDIKKEAFANAAIQLSNAGFEVRRMSQITEAEYHTGRYDTVTPFHRLVLK